MKRVVCSITFYYDPETYLFEWENTRPDDETIFQRCKEMMVEDVTSIENPIDFTIVNARFAE